MPLLLLKYAQNVMMYALETLKVLCGHVEHMILCLKVKDGELWASHCVQWLGLICLLCTVSGISTAPAATATTDGGTSLCSGTAPLRCHGTAAAATTATERLQQAGEPCFPLTQESERLFRAKLHVIFSSCDSSAQQGSLG